MSVILRQQIEKIVPLTDEEFEYTLSFFVRKKYRKHQFVVQHGERVSYEFFVESGLLKSYFTNHEDKTYILQFALEDWWISDYQAYMNGLPASYDIDCIEDSVLLAITLENKNKLCKELQKMEHFFRIKANYGYIALQQRILSLLNDDAREKYRQLFKLYPMLFQRVPKAFLASYIGVSRETLSRISNNFK